MQQMVLAALCTVTAAFQISVAAAAENPGFGLETAWPAAFVVWLGAVFALARSLVAKEWIIDRVGDGAPVLRFLGMMTYPLYLVHIHVGGPIMIALIGNGVSAGLSLLAACIVSLTVAGVIASWLEPPIHRMVIRLVAGVASPSLRARVSGMVPRRSAARP